MPELPEVETTLLGIKSPLVGKTITDIVTRVPALRWPIPSHLQRTLTAQKIVSVHRRAKYLIVETAAGQLIIHLGMSGHLRVLPATAPMKKHDHFELHIGDKMLRLNDPRRFGAVLWAPSETIHPLLESIGPEPLSRAFSARYLASALHKRRSPIKTALLDQKLVAGIGNIYACEALHMSYISPFQPSHELTLDDCQALVTACKTVLRKAIKAGGTTLKDFTRSDGQPGYFKQALLVYGRNNERCTQCETASITVAQIGQRSTFYCEQCQQADKAC